MMVPCSCVPNQYYSTKENQVKPGHKDTRTKSDIKNENEKELGGKKGRKKIESA